MILQDWDEIEALQESLREHMAEIKRLNDCLTWEQHRAEHVGTHGPGCAMWGPKHYECLLRAHEALKKRTSQEFRQVEPVAHISGYKQGYCVIEPIDRNVLFPVGMALYRSLPTSQESQQVEPVAWWNKKYDSVMLMTRLSPQLGGMEGIKSSPAYAAKQLVPLYTVPPKREPLTERMAYEAETLLSNESFRNAFCFGWQQAERAHGVGGEE